MQALRLGVVVGHGLLARMPVSMALHQASMFQAHQTDTRTPKACTQLWCSCID